MITRYKHKASCVLNSNDYTILNSNNLSLPREKNLCDALYLTKNYELKGTQRELKVGDKREE